MRFLLQLLVTMSLLPCLPAHAFRNLDFEEAMPDLSYAPFGSKFEMQPAEEILPHWTTFQIADNETLESEVRYNNDHLGLSPLFIVFDREPSPPFLFRSGLGTPIEGTYSLFFNSFFKTSVGLFQEGLVPAGSKSIRFDGRFIDDNYESPTHREELPADQLNLLLGGEKIEVVDVSAQGEVRQFGANIPAHLVNTTTELRLFITTLQDLTLDNIRFSPIPVPEPSAFVLLVLGLCGLQRRANRAP